MEIRWLRMEALQPFDLKRHRLSAVHLSAVRGSTSEGLHGVHGILRVSALYRSFGIGKHHVGVVRVLLNDGVIGLISLLPAHLLCHLLRPGDLERLLKALS